jgi:hypothetical protein
MELDARMLFCGVFHAVRGFGVASQGISIFDETAMSEFSVGAAV